MQIKLPFDSSKPVAGESSIDIPKSANDVFSYIGKNFFNNYPKWAVEVVQFEPLSGIDVFVGATAKQVRKDNGAEVESIFKITDYQPNSLFIFEGINAPYKHSYLLESDDGQQLTRLTFRFELLELDVFMRPFQKLIRVAIEDGTETTVENIKNLITTEDQ